MTLEACPKCGADSIFAPLEWAVGYDGTLYGGRTEGFCNNPQCDQRFWYVPRSGRITRRNSGMAFKEYQLRRADIGVFNTMRRRLGLPSVAELPMGVLTIVDEAEAERAGIALRTHVRMVGATTLHGRFGRWLTDWCAWFVAYWRVYRPWPFNKKGVSDE